MSPADKPRLRQDDSLSGFSPMVVMALSLLLMK
jgi:hypothetical protein